MSRSRIARVFDGRDVEGRPVVAAERVPLADDERAQVVAFLDGGAVLVAGGPPSPDRLDPAGSPAVPAGYATDGTWIWGAALRYYADRHGLAPEPELLAHIRACGYAARVPSAAEVGHALADLQEHFRAAAAGRAAP